MCVIGLDFTRLKYLRNACLFCNYGLIFAGTVWLQCGEVIKQVPLPKETVTLGHIRQMFEDNFKGELRNYSVAADRGILLIKDPFTRTFKELNDVRYINFYVKTCSILKFSLAIFLCYKDVMLYFN